MNVRCAVLATLAAGVLNGCVGCAPVDANIEAACLQEGTQDDGEEGESTTVVWLGAVRVTERRDAEAGNNPSGTVAASFYDVSNFSTESPTPLRFTATCVGVTGQPSQMGTRMALAVEQVTVSGLSNGPYQLGTDGGLAITGLGAVFADQPVSVAVTGTDGGFVDLAFDPVAVPEQLSVSQPDLGGSANIGQDDLTVRWSSGSGTGAVQLELSVVREGQRAAISCVVADDGCHVVPAGLITWLTQARNDPITVIMRRSVVASALAAEGPDGGAGAVFSMTSEARGRINP